MTTTALVFPVGEDQYAVAVSVVREVVSGVHPTVLPTAPPVFLGAINLRGEVVPLFDTAALLGIGTIADASIALIVNTGLGAAGLVVSGLPVVAVLDHEIGPSELRGTLGVYSVENGFAVMVDIEELLVPQANVGASVSLEAVDAVGVGG